MLQYTDSQNSLAMPVVEDAPGYATIDIGRIFAAARRQIRWILGSALVGLLIGVSYVFTVEPIYTASTDILIDAGRAQALSQSAPDTNTVLNDALVMNQIQVMKSERLAQSVVTKLGLTTDDLMVDKDSAFGEAKDLLKNAVMNLVSSEDRDPRIRLAPTPDEAIASAVAVLRQNLTVERLALSYVLHLSYSAPDPELAAQIASAFGEAYIADQLNAKYEASDRASGWLQGRLSELKQQSLNADVAVQDFRNQNGLLTSGRELVSEQQLAEMSKQLMSAQAATAEAKARLDQINALIASGRPDAAVDDALASSTITNLRTRYLEASRQQAEIARRAGPDHIQSVRLLEQMREFQRLISEELTRIANSYQSTYEVASTREKSARDSLEQITQLNTVANTTQVRLRELERQAATFRSLYETFLQRYQENIQEQSFPITDARTITLASVPNAPSFPRTGIMLALFTCIGLAAGSGLAAFAEHRDWFFRTGDQVRQKLQLDFLGSAPKVDSATIRDYFESGGEAQELWLPGGRLNSYVRDHPFSPFAETLRNVKVSIDLNLSGRRCKVIGLTSCLPEEGKTTISANLATLLAMLGSRVLLIDGDLRNPSLSKALRSGREDESLVETVQNRDKLDSRMFFGDSGKLVVLPVPLKRISAFNSGLLYSDGMAKVLVDAQSEFDYILVDLPPIGPVVDAKAFTSNVDAFVFVVEWGRTPHGLVQKMIVNNRAVYDKCLGVVLNKVDDARMRLYATQESEEYYVKKYGAYYRFPKKGKKGSVSS